MVHTTIAINSKSQVAASSSNTYLTPQPSKINCTLEAFSAVTFLDVPACTTASSSSSKANKTKRTNPYAGMSITRVGSEESDEDLDHLHICKRVSQEFNSARNLLLATVARPSQSSVTEIDDSTSLFQDFMKDMPLPEGYSEKFDGRLSTNTACFTDLSSFLSAPTFSDSCDLDSDSCNIDADFWKTMYIMQQESH